MGKTKSQCEMGLTSWLSWLGWLSVSFVVCRLSFEAVAKPSRDEARPSHTCANLMRDLHFGRDGLCPVHFRKGFAIASAKGGIVFC